MIQFAEDSTKQLIWDMWKTVFGDSDDYMQIYFKHKYRNENTLIYFEDDKAAASLQMLDYQFTYCGQEIPVYYLSGVSTIAEFRGKGYARKLLLKSFEVAQERNIPLVILVPQERWLLNFYEKFGFAQTFDSGKELLISLKKIIDDNEDNLYNAYKEFDALYRNEDMTVQKSYKDFLAIAEEARLFGFPSKKNLIGMSRIIDAEQIVNLFARMYRNKSFTVSVRDELLKDNNTEFIISSGKVQKGISKIIQPHLDLNIREFTQAIMGFHTSEKNSTISTIFPEKRAIMNFMLE